MKLIIERLSLAFSKGNAMMIPTPRQKSEFQSSLTLLVLALRNEFDKEENKMGIHTLIQTATTDSGNINNLPFEKIIREISAFKSRRGK